MQIQHDNMQQNPAGVQNNYDQQPFGASLYDRSRNAFVRKVYTILTIQFAITAIFCVFSMNISAFANFQLNHIGLFYSCIVGILVTEIIIYFCGQGRKYPNNIILLGIFTVLQSYVVSTICGLVAQQGLGELVLLAAISTAGIFFGLTIYACTTTKDFTTPRGIAVVLLCSLIQFMLWMFISPYSVLYDMYLAVGIVVFGIYLVVDTQLIVGGKNGRISMDDYVIASMFLYIDVVQIFLRILILLYRAKRN